MVEGNIRKQETQVFYEADEKAVWIAKCAWKAMLEEVYTTPKPGLVDFYSNGAHKDMDVHTFEKSARAIYPYFVRMALQGCRLRCTPEMLFREIRKTGQIAEQMMYRATGGVNTHKGLIFTMGIFCGAAGRCLGEAKTFSKEYLSQMQKEMTTRILLEELAEYTGKEAVSNGEKNQKAYGTLGIRGEAAAGYPGIWETALPVLREGVCSGKDWNKVKLQSLLTLMSSVEDSNILARHNPQVLKAVQEESEEFLKAGGAYQADAIEKLQKMDGDFIQRNISAGGCADLLAASIFIDMLLQTKW